MKKPKRKSIPIVPSSADIVGIATDAATSAIVSVSSAADAQTYLLHVGASFAANRVGKWGMALAAYIKSGRAKTGNDAEAAYAKFFETLRFLAKEQPADDALLEALQSLHVLSLSKETSVGEATEIYMMIDTLKQLKGEEILTLLAAYKIGKNLLSKEDMARVSVGYDIPTSNAASWCTMISRVYGYSSSEYVARQQSHLEELALIADRDMDVRFTGRKVNNFTGQNCFRLTESGLKLAEFITRGKASLAAAPSD